MKAKKEHKKDQVVPSRFCGHPVGSYACGLLEDSHKYADHKFTPYVGEVMIGDW